VERDETFTHDPLHTIAGFDHLFTNVHAAHEWF